MNTVRAKFQFHAGSIKGKGCRWYLYEETDTVSIPRWFD